MFKGTNKADEWLERGSDCPEFERTAWLFEHAAIIVLVALLLTSYLALSIISLVVVVQRNYGLFLLP